MPVRGSVRFTTHSLRLHSILQHLKLNSRIDFTEGGKPEEILVASHTCGSPRPQAWTTRKWGTAPNQRMPSMTLYPLLIIKKLFLFVIYVGGCPRIMKPKPCLTKYDRKEYCKTDSNCPRGQKCCFDGCIKRCGSFTPNPPGSMPGGNHGGAPGGKISPPGIGMGRSEG